MLGSWLLQLTTVSAVLLAAAVVALLRVSRRAHRAELPGAAQRRHLAVSATLLGVGGLGLAGLLGADVWSAVAVAAVLSGTVLAWGRAHSPWPVRGVTAKAMGATTAVAAVVWLLHRVTFSSSSAAAVVASAAMVPLIVWALVHLRGPWEAWVEARTSAEGQGRSSGEPSVVRSALVLTAAAATGGAVLALTSGGAPVGPVSPVARADGPGHPTSIRPEPTQPRPEGSSSSPRSAPSSSAGPALGPSPTPEPVAPAPSSTAPQELSTVVEQPDGLVTVSPSVTPSPEATKTPGYVKGNPNRPSDAPSPGGPAKP